MSLSSQTWLEVIRREYLCDFIQQGGSAVKFIVPKEKVVGEQLCEQLSTLSNNEGYQFVFINASTTKIHMIDKLFHEIAKNIDWDELAYNFTFKNLSKHNLKISSDRNKFNLAEIAELNELPEMILGDNIKNNLIRDIFKDYKMSQAFRIAMIKLCMAQLDHVKEGSFLSDTIKEWLRGELRTITSLSAALIFQKISRHNARHNLFSLTHWLKLNGKKGLVLNLDISRYTIASRPIVPDVSNYYSVSATYDAYEVLRQFIDGIDEIESCLIVVTATPDFLDSYNSRSMYGYGALRLRIEDEVKDRVMQNPLCSLIRLSSEV